MITKVIKEAIEAQTEVLTEAIEAPIDVLTEAIGAQTGVLTDFMEAFESHQDLFFQGVIPADALAADTFERAIFTAPFNCVVKDVRVVPDGDIGQATNYMTLDCQNKGADGTGTTSIGLLAVDDTNKIEGFVGVDLVSTDAEVTEGHSLTLKKTIEGDGQAFLVDWLS